MPKMIGHEARELDALASPRLGDVQVSFAQARLLRRAGVAIRSELDRSDRGGIRTYAKRWYRWYADRAEICACAVATRAMLARARHGGGD